MNSLSEDLMPPTRLALAYAPKHLKNAWELLLRFDIRMKNIVGATTEPLIGQMKLAWWRDAIAADPSARPKGEPLLSSMSQLGNPALDRAAAALVDAWETLIVSDCWTMPIIDRFAQDRGSIVFGFFGQLACPPAFPDSLAQQWAAADLRLQFGDRVPKAIPTPGPFPRDRALRPLTIMAMSVHETSGPRLIWHALTGH